MSSLCIYIYIIIIIHVVHVILVRTCEGGVCRLGAYVWGRGVCRLGAYIYVG